MDTPLRLLILEDDPNDALLIQKLLQRAGLQFSATVVSDEKEFLKTLDENGFDLVLSDNALPQYNSLEALEEIKKRNPFIAFILVTGTVSEEFAVNIIQRGADDYILKSNLTRLPAAIRKAIENRNAQRARKEAEKELREKNLQLRKLAAHIQNIREEEQTRLAREIHDQLGQLMTGLKLDLAWIEKNTGGNIGAEGREKIKEMSALLTEAMTSIRKISADLRPSILDDLGMADALHWQGKEFEKRSGILVHFKNATKQSEFDPEISIGLFRIYQEVLTNVARHANAIAIETTLDVAEKKIILSVTDDGKGFDPASKKKSLGLLGMRERAIMMGGDINITSEPGKGTTVIINVPLYKE